MSTIKVNGIRGVGASTDAISVNNTDGTCTANITNNLSNRNLIINGSCIVAQYGTSSTSLGYKTVDRFKLDTGGTDEAVTQAQHALTSSDTGPWAKGFRSSYHLTNGNQTSGAGAADWVEIQYNIEAQDLANSGWEYTSTSSNITISFWAQASVAQTYYVYLQSLDGTAQLYAFSFALSANTWTKVTKTIPGAANVAIDNNNGNGLRIGIVPFYGTNYTTSGFTLNTWAAHTSSNMLPDNTSTWYTTNDATFEITGLQLEVSDHATDFEFLPYGVEEERCKRYFHRLVGGASDYWLQAAKYTNDTSIGIIHWSPWMRDIPTLSFNTGTNYHTFYSDSDESGANVSGSGWSIQQASKKSAGLRYLLTGSESGMSFAGSGDGIFWFSSSSATVDLNAEL